jgi:2-dehydro-3-deoxy-D-arabinonate dehydratase
VTAIWRVATETGPRLARGPVEAGPTGLLAAGVTLGSLLAEDGPGLDDVGGLPAQGDLPPMARLLSPVDHQPVWAAGVTFERSWEARKEESAQPDHYDLVYDAERPELFVKALPGDSRGPGEPIGIRPDSSWDVPEPELGLVADARGRLAGYVLGNDVSSRSIEGENPLYLPQAKVYDGSCALGPCVVPVRDAPPLAEIQISLTIRRGAAVGFSDTVELARMHRRVDDLLDWLFRAVRFPHGVVLLSGTSIVPGPEVSLAGGDVVEISATGLGTLANPVETVRF